MIDSTSTISVSSDLVITAPTIYLQERFPALKSEIEQGNSVVFNYAMNVKNIGLQQSLQVAIQSDYATWKGTRQYLNSL